jgi:hypothetical protein
MCAKFPFVGPERGHDAIKKIEQLHLDGNKPTKETIAWLYSVLNILDGKANGLLRVNGLFITLLVFFWGAARSPGNPLHITYDQLATAVLALLLLMASTIFCFMIVRINWKFLGQVRAKQDDPQQFDFDSEVKRLANIVDNRTHYYWIGWFLTLVAVILPVVLWVRLPPLLWVLYALESYLPAPS